MHCLFPPLQISLESCVTPEQSPSLCDHSIFLGASGLQPFTRPMVLPPLLQPQRHMTKTQVLAPQGSGTTRRVSFIGQSRLHSHTWTQGGGKIPERRETRCPRAVPGRRKHQISRKTVFHSSWDCFFCPFTFDPRNSSHLLRGPGGLPGGGACRSPVAVVALAPWCLVGGTRLGGGIGNGWDQGDLSLNPRVNTCWMFVLNLAWTQ